MLGRLITISFIIILASCQKDEKQIRKIGFSQCCEDEWRESMELEMRRETSLLEDVELLVRNAKNNTDLQKEHIQELLEADVDILIVSPNESSALNNILDSIHRTGFNVILLDRNVEGEEYTTFIGADNVEIGKSAAKYLKSKLPQGIHALQIELGRKMSPSIDRSDGFINELSRYTNSELVGSVEDRDGFDQIKIEVDSIVQNNRNVNAVFAQNDWLAQEASKWAKEWSLDHKVYIVGVDGLIGERGGTQMILDQKIDATVYYPTGGEEAISAAVSILNGELPQKKLELTSFVINEINALMMQRQGAKLLNQQIDIERQSQLIEDQGQTLKNQKSVTIILSLFSGVLMFLVGLVVFQLRRNKKVADEVAFKNIQISQQNEELEELTKINEETHKEKVEFFTNISHEFKTPLTLIMAPIDDMIENCQDLSFEYRNQLKLVQRNAQRMQRLIRQLMDFRKIDTKHLKPKFQELNLIEFLKEVMSVFVNLKESRNIDFKLMSHLTTSIIISDYEMLDKVFFNLISNAFKFTEENGYIYLQVAESNESEEVVIKVSDNGRGMSKEHAEHVFERFYQGDNYSAKGTGLGLSLSQKLIKLLNGHISVVSERGIGTTFTVRLPKNQSVEITSLPPTNRENYSDKSQLIGLIENELSISQTELPDDSKLFEKAILIIEDNIDLSEFLKIKLSQSYRVFTALNGEDGIQLAKENIPNLILCDLMLPTIQGDEIVDMLKADVMTGHIPIIMMTAKDTDSQILSSIDQGVYDFVAKPFKHEVLLGKINGAFKTMDSFKEYFGREQLLGFDQSKLSGDEIKLLDAFDEFIKSNYHNAQLSVEDICRHMAKSKVQLYRKIKAITGTTINEYLTNVRLEKSKELLSNSQLSLAEIAHKCGFNSSSYFSTSFKKVVGTSPSDWKKSVKQYS